MKFPNLVYAISLKRLPHYEIAQAVGMSEWRFSRLLNGRSELLDAERKRIAEVLGFDDDWLFERPKPKPRAFDAETTAATA
jgi:cyanate lyase